jgi:hypothetical protein
MKRGYLARNGRGNVANDSVVWQGRGEDISPVMILIIHGKARSGPRMVFLGMGYGCWLGMDD